MDPMIAVLLFTSGGLELCLPDKLYTAIYFTADRSPAPLRSTPLSTIVSLCLPPSLPLPLTLYLHYMRGHKLTPGSS